MKDVTLFWTSMSPGIRISHTQALQKITVITDIIILIL